MEGHHHPNPNYPQSTLSRKSSVATRNSTLIKKYTGPNELRPSDVLLERFQGWKTIVKNLIAYFEGIADIESNTAKELTKLGGVIQVPFRSGNQFLGEGGVQDVFFGIRDKTRLIADHHASLAKTVDMSIVQHLVKLKTEIKAHIKNIQNDTGKLAAIVAKERELSTHMITDLARSITMFKNTPMSVTAKEDPWFTNQLVSTQLSKQVNEENSLQKSIIIMQQNSAHFEAAVVRSIQSAWETFDHWSKRMSQQVQDTWDTMGVLMKSVHPNTEWNSFASRTDHLLDPDTPLRNPETINYPGKDDPSVIPVHSGILERKKRFTKRYTEGFYVLTAAGYLHEFRSSDVTKHTAPDLSLFLPVCTLGAPSAANSKSFKFHIEGDSKQEVSVKGQRKGSIGRLGRGEHAYTFRARSREDLMEWWNDIKQLSRVYLTSSEYMDRSGPVPAAVRRAGYLSDEEEDEEEDGSSIEEEYDEEEEEEEVEPPVARPTTGAPLANAQPAGVTVQVIAQGQNGQAQGQDERVPAYVGPSATSGVQVGENGYAVEKKTDPATNGVHAGEAPTSPPSFAAQTVTLPPGTHLPGMAPPDPAAVPTAPAPANKDGEHEGEGGLLSKFKEMLPGGH